MTFKEKLTAGPVLFDGAMGTWYAEKYGETLQGCEMANLHHSGRVLAIHREYVAADATP
jgi:homocysteine S-methyltransferase